MEESKFKKEGQNYVLYGHSVCHDNSLRGLQSPEAHIQKVKSGMYRMWDVISWKYVLGLFPAC